MKIKSIITFIGLFPILAFGQISERMDSLMLSHESKGFNGNVLYSKGDTIVFTGNYGYREIDKKIPLNDSSVFELASCSKQFTALAIVQLIENGMLSYQTKVEEVIEDFPYHNVTIEHLLRHQSGLPDYMGLFSKQKVWKRDEIATNQDVIDAFQKFKPKIEFEPGTSYKYSNTGYLLLASIIEIVSDLSYEDYLREKIFIPAQMKNSRVYRRRYKPEEISNLTQGYVFSKKKKSYVMVDVLKKYKYTFWLDGIVGDGMVKSTILDLEKWKQAIRYNKLISQKNKEKMFTTDEISSGYGYGFFIDEREKSGKLVYHFGGWAGYYTMTFYLPKTNEYIIVLSNNQYENNSGILAGILKLRK